MTRPVRQGGFRQRASAWFPMLAGKGTVVLPVRVGGTEYRRPTDTTPASVLGFDQALLWVVVALLAWGLVMVYSASIAMPDNPRFASYASTHFLARHAMYITIGFVAALLAFQVPMALWERAAPWLFVLALVLLVAVLIPGLGKMVNGARRWLSIGPIGFQPSEVAKFAVLIYAADYMVRKMEVKERFFRAVLPMGAAVGIVGVLLLAEPDMGAFMVVAVIASATLLTNRGLRSWQLERYERMERRLEPAAGGGAANPEVAESLP
jgi:cell division protein FtsW